MKQIWISKYGKPEALELKETEIQTPTADEVQIRVKAAGVNFADILARKGLYPDAPNAPCVIGYEVAGTVEVVGENIGQEWKGKEVLALTHFGGYSDILNVPLKQVYIKPDELTFEQAAAIPVNYLTAYQLLVVMGSLKCDETVLIQNAGGGVGLAALDIAKKIGAKTIGTASESKHNFLRQKGFDYVLNYRQKGWQKQVLEITGGKGVELIIDPIGGKSWKDSIKLLRSTGRLGMFGVSSVMESKLLGFFKFLKLIADSPIFMPLSLVNNNKGVFGVNMANLWDESAKVSLWMEEILADIKSGLFMPHVDKAFRFGEAAQAHRYIEERRNLGKVVLVP
jgi:synaptic vesicle membrane protein VAT-1